MFQVGVVCGDQFVFGHHLVDRTVHVTLETQVTVGHDTDQGLIFRYNRNAADVVLFHQHQGIAYGIVFADGDGVVDHAVLGTFDLAYLCGLLCDTHIFVNHTDTSFTGDSDCQLSFGHGIHSGRNDRGIDEYITRETRSDRYLAGKHFRISRDKQDIIECESFGLNLISNERHVGIV